MEWMEQLKSELGYIVQATQKEERGKEGMSILSSLLCKGWDHCLSLWLDLCHCLRFLTRVSGQKGKTGNRVKAKLWDVTILEAAAGFVDELHRDLFIEWLLLTFHFQQEFSGLCARAFSSQLTLQNVESEEFLKYQSTY